MNRKPGRRWLLPVALFVSLGGALAAETLVLDPQELGSAVAHIKAAALFHKAAAGKKDPRLAVASAWKYRDPEARGKGEEVVEVLFFKYEGGVTIRAAVDAKSGEVLEVEELRAYPTPLASDELAEAVRLAGEQSEAVRKLIAGARPGDIVNRAFAPVISDPKDSRYGHRIAVLTVYHKAERLRAVKVEVDLTVASVKPFAL
jgi:hypothetical protein